MVGLGSRFVCDTIVVSQAGLIVDLGNDKEICGTETVTLDAGSGGVSYAWSTSEITQSIIVTSGGTYSVTVDDGVCINTDEVLVVKCAENIFIPNTITPNGDGENDTWIIEGLDNFPGNTVVIMNRNGSMVYQSTDYQSDWSAAGLPASTYYFILDLNDGVSNFKGSISIIRQE
jgi:gliding motility-associated-like protein